MAQHLYDSRSFSSFVTLRLVRFLYALVVIFLVTGMLVVMAAGMSEADNAVEAVGLIVLAPVGAFI